MFTSPQDDHIDRASYFERCFPTMDRLRRHELLHVTPADADDVSVLYEYELRRMTPRAGGDAMEHTGRFIALWRHEVDGTWPIDRYIDDTPEVG